MYTYAIIGFGGLGRVHLSTLNRLTGEGYDLRLAAICGTTAEIFKESVSLNIGESDCSDIDISESRFYDDYKKLIDEITPDFIVSAVPTYLHEEIAVYALTHGVSVFSEKPMALSEAACVNMAEAAKQNNAFLMIGQCLRFDPAVCMLKKYIETGVYGKAYRAEFTRYSQTPLWSWNNWILDQDKSGGCIIDMHIHDVDAINWLFGKPRSVHSVSTESKVQRESIFTQYDMDGGMVVTSSADWSMPQKFPFEARILVNFEKACAVVNGYDLTVYTDDEVLTPDLGDENCFYHEMKEFIECAAHKRESRVTSPESVADSIRIALAELESAKTGKTVIL